MTIVLFILLIVFLLLLKGFFSGSEIALVNSDKIKLTAKANMGNRGAREALDFFKTPDTMLGTTLVGTNVATVALTTLLTIVFIRLFGDRGDVYAYFVFTPLLLILGEIVPKSIFQQKSDQVVPLAIYPLKVFSLAFYPVIFIFSRLARLIARILGAGKIEQNFFMTREQIRSVVDMTEKTSAVNAFDRGRIRRVIRFADTTVGEAMIPIAEVTAINHSRGILRAIATVRRKGFNRIPVYRGNISNIVGIVTLTTWDLMDRSLTEKELEDFIRPAHYVLQFQTIDQLLPVLRQREDRMAVVVDEFGSAIGIITMEDIVEEVVGDIDVGYDFDEYLPRRKSVVEKFDKDAYLVDSRLSIFDLNEQLEINLNTRVAHTIGGLVMNLLGHIPEAGESVVEQGYRFTVEDRTEKGVVSLRVEKV
ncbi:MAG: HlyC/CorC family transporter [Gammaproteobacteria bacterium]|nr:HlyC/CorC family transporter [Gammaproteobacteria bacterium]MYD76490.1 HlyC/CorC family transporter [Gammaproteobacteria bacterium]